jgi:mRNA interferase MazF
MQKEFTQWNTQKIMLNDSIGKALFHEREVWWCQLGVNVGYEQDGNSDLFSRPVVIIKKFNLDACLVVPLTTKQKTGKYYFSIGKVAEREATAVLSQIRFVDRRRLVVKIQMLQEGTFLSLVNTIMTVCFPHTSP